MPPIHPEEEDYHVHLTGFGPFGRYSSNPSWEAVKPLNKRLLTSPPPPLHSAGSPEDLASSSSRQRAIRLTSSLLPVTYKAASSFVSLLHREGLDGSGRPDLLIHVGVGLSGAVKLEQRARKWGYEKQDVEGEMAGVSGDGTSKRGCVVKELEGVQDELRTSVDGKRVLEWVKRKGVEHLDLSEDAGLYLCEFTYYTSMASSRLFGQDNPVPVQFVHVPPLDEPYTLEQLTAIIRLIVWALVNEGGISA
ncbi:hypothetical protein JCM11251_001401 [Rhodosporidiobolus azoricus]